MSRKASTPKGGLKPHPRHRQPRQQVQAQQPLGGSSRGWMHFRSASVTPEARDTSVWGRFAGAAMIDLPDGPGVILTRLRAPVPGRA
jgi:hypothetical protein